MAEHGGGQHGPHGGGHNNLNKKEQRAAAAPSGPPAVHSAAVRAPGAQHIIGSVPPPVEVTNRPARRN